MIIKSLFDGYSAGYMALKRAGIKITKYEAYEIDKYCIQVSQNNHPEIIQKGDVKNCKIDSWIDLLIAGSPCQGFSKAGNQLNFQHKKSKLLFEFVRILKEALKINPNVLFLLENVRMKKEWEDIITEIVSVKPILINSSLVSAQNRERLYWTNIHGINQPGDKSIELKDIIQSGDDDRDKSYCIDANYFKGTNVKQYLCKKRRQIVWIIPEATKKKFVEVSEGNFIDLTFIKSKTRRGRLMLKKSNCLTATNYKYCKVTKDWFRLLTPIECERLQTLPDNYTEGVSNMQRYKMLGNGWTVDVISHIFSFIPRLEETSEGGTSIPPTNELVGTLEVIL